jgi:hypothetical protein
MNRSYGAGLMLLLLLASVAFGQPRKTEVTSTAGNQEQSGHLVEKLIKFLGIADTPGTLKGAGDKPRSGQVWVAELDSGRTRAITDSVGYRSPVFIAASRDIIALKGTEVWLLPAESLQRKRLFSVDGITKLVASSADDPDKVLVLLSNVSGGHPRVGMLSISTTKVTPELYDATSRQDLQIVENMQGWEKVYGDKRIYVKRETKQALSGPVEWTDVFQKANGEEPVNVSRCGGANCGQPSMSADGQQVVFVRDEGE